MKLSPLSIPYRVVGRGVSLAFTAFFLVATGASVVGDLPGRLVAAVLVGLGLIGLIGYEVAHWQRYEYELTADTFDIRSGVFARREREIPIGRIQNVDIRRNVVQRGLGIAALDLETAGGGGTEAAIRFVPFEEAKRLQREIAEQKRGRTPETTEEREELFALSPRELALVGALSFDPRIPGLLFFLLSGSATAVPMVTGLRLGAGALAMVGLGAVVLLAVALLSWGVGATIAVLNYYGFRLDRVGDELQYERGLLRRYDGSIPLDKVQTLTVQDNPLKRRFGFASLFIETAGHVRGGSSGRGGDRGSQAAVPLARVERVEELARDIEPYGVPELERPPGRVRRRYVARYLIGVGALVATLYAAESLFRPGIPWYGPLALVPVLAVVAHYKWIHRGYWLGEDHFVARNGVIRRETKVVPYYRVQTVIDSRTIFQRRWRLGTVTADTAGSLSLVGSDAAAVDVDEATADRLREELVERLRTALAAYGRNRGWRWGEAAVTAAARPADDASDEGSDADENAPETGADAEDAGAGLDRDGPEPGDAETDDSPAGGDVGRANDDGTG